jgi:hypothetical protein
MWQVEHTWESEPETPARGLAIAEAPSHTLYCRVATQRTHTLGNPTPTPQGCV